MSAKWISWYLKTSLLARILTAFVSGSLTGGLFWWLASRYDLNLAVRLAPFVAPFGTVLIGALKMIVVPVIFFSLISGAAALPLRQFGRIGVKVMLWYLGCSLVAAGIGVLLALQINPGGTSDFSGWQQLADSLGGQITDVRSGLPANRSFGAFLMNLLKNPFEALATNNFLAIILFSIAFGLALRVLIETHNRTNGHSPLHLLELINTVREAIFRMVDWILEYSPLGVFALAITNFGVYGPQIIGPYVGVALGVIAGVLVMMVLFYPLLLALVTRRNPFQVICKMDKAIITAFITRSSAATLPVSLRVAESRLGVRNELAAFSLPLGATVNMDGVCVHLPMFAVLAANMFNVTLTFTDLIILVMTTVLASIGAGGVPGGSVILLFIILETLGLDSSQVAVIVALAMGINPILDMFETANNITGDLVCTYAVAHREKLLTDVKQPT